MNKNQLNTKHFISTLKNVCQKTYILVMTGNKHIFYRMISIKPPQIISLRSYFFLNLSIALLTISAICKWRKRIFLPLPKYFAGLMQIFEYLSVRAIAIQTRARIIDIRMCIRRNILRKVPGVCEKYLRKLQGWWCWIFIW